jgi:hypothetical protein
MFLAECFKLFFWRQNMMLPRHVTSFLLTVLAGVNFQSSFDMLNNDLFSHSQSLFPFNPYHYYNVTEQIRKTNQRPGDEFSLCAPRYLLTARCPAVQRYTSRLWPASRTVMVCISRSSTYNIL